MNNLQHKNGPKFDGDIVNELAEAVVQLQSVWREDEDNQKLLEMILLEATKRGDGAELFIQDMSKPCMRDSAALPINAIKTIAKLAKNKETLEKVFTAIHKPKNNSDLEEAARVVEAVNTVYDSGSVSPPQAQQQRCRKRCISADDVGAALEMVDQESLSSLGFSNESGSKAEDETASLPSEAMAAFLSDSTQLSDRRTPVTVEAALGTEASNASCDYATNSSRRPGDGQENTESDSRAFSLICGVTGSRNTADTTQE